MFIATGSHSSERSKVAHAANDVTSRSAAADQSREPIIVCQRHSASDRACSQEALAFVFSSAHTAQEAPNSFHLPRNSAPVSQFVECALLFFSLLWVQIHL